VVGVLNNLECCRNTFTDKNDTDIVVHDSDEIIDDNSMAQIIDMTEGFEEVTDDELPSTSHATPTTHCLYTIEAFIMHDYVSVIFISKCVSTTFQIIQWLHTI
jgi:hypothetical protein